MYVRYAVRVYCFEWQLCFVLGYQLPYLQCCQICDSGFSVVAGICVQCSIINLSSMERHQHLSDLHRRIYSFQFSSGSCVQCAPPNYLACPRSSCQAFLQDFCSRMSSVSMHNNQLSGIKPVEYLSGCISGFLLAFNAHQHIGRRVRLPMCAPAAILVLTQKWSLY